jgi:hypothetical protein
MLRHIASVLALSCFLSRSPAFAQTGLPPAADALADRAESATVGCPGAAVFSAGGGPEVHVMRVGTLDQRNPLAPLTDAQPATVLEVKIRGKLAAAYGPNFQELRRAGPPQDLERELGNAIEWKSNLAELPRNMLILGSEKAEVIARLQFVKCLAIPKARPPREERVKAPSAKPPSTSRQERPALPIPRGTLE